MTPDIDPVDLLPLFRFAGDKASISALFSRRLVFVMGKGGTGKTTLSVCLALIAEKMGLTSLIVEIGDSAGTAQFFKKREARFKPTLVSSGIWTSGVNPKAELAAYIHFHMKSRFIAGRIVKSRLFDYLLAATPGLKEIMTFGRIWRWYSKVGPKDHPLYDMIIVDTPATGHGLSLLRLPKNLGDMIGVGPIAKQVKTIQNLITDPVRTAVTAVTLPEELPVNETLEMIAVARRLVGVDIAPVFINSVYPDIFCPKDAELADSMFSGPNTGALIRSWIKRYRYQRSCIDYLRKNVTCPVILLPFLFTNELTIGEVRRLALHLYHNLSD